MFPIFSQKFRIEQHKLSAYREVIHMNFKQVSNSKDLKLKRKINFKFSDLKEGHSEE